jgi:lipopolysaccharide biosynthesis regulator YciM
MSVSSFQTQKKLVEIWQFDKDWGKKIEGILSENYVF